METLDQIKARVAAVVPGAKLDIVPNDSPAKQLSLLVDNEHAVSVAKFLRDDPELQLDYCSNVTGVDWPEAELTEKLKVKKVVDGVEREVEEVKKTKRPGYLEAVYHLYSMSLKHGPVIIRLDVIFAHRMVLKIVPHQDATQIGMAVERDAIKVVDFALLKFAAAPDKRQG